VKRRGSRWALLAIAGFLAACAAYVFTLPDVRPLKKGPITTTAFIELRKRQAAAEGKKLRVQMIWAPYDRISENLRHAVITAEDDMFYRHQGIDWESTKIALVKDWEARKMKYGASTITQQLARNLYLSPTKNPLRKIKEMLIARSLEKTLGKRRILELYLNIAEWGKGIFGAEAAARAYFGKSAADLTPDEAVAMAVVLPSPRRLNPAKGGRYVERNMRRVMGRMRASGLLPEETPPQTILEEAETTPLSDRPVADPLTPRP
jgi:monofunctional biosynthetic peptidoglycan transglycosylase